MSDSGIFNEKNEFLTTKGITEHIRNSYTATVGVFGNREEIDHHRVRQGLAMNWPGNDQIRQILKDTFDLLIENDIKLTDIKW